MNRLPCRFWLAALVLLVLAGALPLGAQTASLVRDINTEAAAYGATLQQLTAVDGKVFFAGYQTGTGQALWGSDGTAEGARLLLDRCPGPCSSSVWLLGGLRHLLLFGAGPSLPTELWRSDGTQAGTFRLAPLNLNLVAPVVFRDALYFWGCTEGDGCALWKTDGSTAGTVRLQSGLVSALAPAGDRLFFAIRDGNGATALWSTGGTPATTTLVKALGTGELRQAAALGSRLLFIFFQAGQKAGLWASDGTAGGTQPLQRFDLVHTELGLQPAGGRVYLAADDGVYGNEVWATDGTVQGTRRATGFALDEPRISQLHGAGSRAVFVAADGVHGLQLWSTAGTPESAAAVPNPCAGCTLVDEATVLAVGGGGRVFFLAEEPAHGRELWTTDGTAAGTHPAADVCPGPCDGVADSLRFGLRPTAQGVLFNAADPVHGEELWATDGTAAGTRRLSDLPGDVHPLADDPRPPYELEAAAVGSQVYFSAYGESTGTALWVSEGTASSRQVAVVAPQGPSSFPLDLTALGDRLLFVATDGAAWKLWSSQGTAETTLPLGLDASDTGGVSWQPTVVGSQAFLRRSSSRDAGSLWRTDGTPAGTVLLTTGIGGGGMTAYQGRLAFPADGSIWQSDGTAAGTVKLLDVPTPDFTEARGLTGLGADLYFAIGDPYHYDHQIWHSDGSPGGTRKIADVHVTDFGYLPGFVRLGSRVLFRADTVWATDGTPGGTAPLLPGGQGVTGLAPRDLTVLAGAAYFFAGTAAGERGLWRTDGTPAGTTLLHEFPVPDPARPPDTGLVAGLGRLWFAADDGVHGTELWTSDGTAAGTALLRDVRPGPEESLAYGLTIAGDHLYFTADDGVHGFELWQSDGTAAGTRLTQDIAPLALPSAPGRLTAVGNRLYFAADDGPTGNELWSLPLAGPGGCQPSSTALCLQNGRYRVEARWRDFQGHAGAGHAVPLTADTGTFWFFAPENVEAIVKVLDGQGVNGHVWVFYGALSSVEYTLTVTDTQTGLTRQYFNPAGQLASAGDTHAFGPLGAAAASQRPVVAPPSPLPIVAETEGKAAAAPCQPSAQRLCLSGGRFSVEVAWKDFQGHTGQGTAVPLTGDTGTFWFFNAANVELVVKVLDGRPVNGKLWLFYGALSNVEYTLTVTDTETGTVRTYTNPSGRFASVADTNAF
jgi:ELWxxDGT repeat protein